MKNQFWAGLGSGAVLVKKKFGADYEQLLRKVFLCFQGPKKIFFDNIVRTEKLHRKKVKKKFRVFVLFYRLKFECNLRSGQASVLLSVILNWFCQLQFLF